MFIVADGIAVVILKKVMQINIHGYATKIDKVLAAEQLLTTEIQNAVSFFTC